MLVVGLTANVIHAGHGLVTGPDSLLILLGERSKLALEPLIPRHFPRVFGHQLLQRLHCQRRLLVAADFPGDVDVTRLQVIDAQFVGQFVPGELAKPGYHIPARFLELDVAHLRRDAENLRHDRNQPRLFLLRQVRLRPQQRRQLPESLPHLRLQVRHFLGGRASGLSRRGLLGSCPNCQGFLVSCRNV